MSGLNELLWLTTREGMRPETATAMLNAFGTAEAVYFADPAEYDSLPLSQTLKRSLRDKSLEGVRRILECCDRKGIWIMTYRDGAYPERLQQLKDYPLVLYGLGRRLRFDEELAIGMVGARKCTPYGLAMAGRLGLELARSGAVVVSGLAQGIDGASLRAALKGGGTVVSVLACGVDVVYPRCNRDLYEDVAASGVLLSESPPGTPPDGWRFPIRNRIISGLSVGVVAVEGEEHSGTLTTARRALDQDREVFAVPGPADAPMSAGTNALIARGEAKLVRCAGDILVEYMSRFPHKFRPVQPLSEAAVSQRLEQTQPPAAPENPAAASEEPEPVLPVRPVGEWEGLGDEQREIFRLTQVRPMTADELVGETEIPARRVNTALTLLQAQGYLNELPGRRFTAAVRFEQRE